MTSECAHQCSELIEFLLRYPVTDAGVAQASNRRRLQPSAEISNASVSRSNCRSYENQQQALLNSMQKQVADFNARIAAMEAELGVTPSKDQPAQADWVPKALHRFRPLHRTNPPSEPDAHAPPGARHSGE